MNTTMPMDLETFKERLLADPECRTPEMAEARDSSPEHAEAAAAALAFESELKTAFDVRPPAGLAERIIERQRQENHPARQNATPWMWATAAALVLAVGSITFHFTGHPEDAAGHGDVWSHLAWHWEMDGVETLQASQTSPTTAEEVREVLASLGVEADPALLEQVSLGKFCPTPDGRGAHIVLESDDGPITLMIMPNTHVPHAPASAMLDDGTQSWVVNLEHGSMAVIAEPDRNAGDIARELQRKFSVQPGLSL